MSNSLVHKFKPGQEVTISQFLINGTKLDLNATVYRYVYNKDTKTWNPELLVNGTYIVIKEDRLEDSVEFWNKKNAMIT